MEWSRKDLENKSKEELIQIIINFKEENIQTLKRKVVIFDNTDKQLKHNKLKLVKLRKFCLGESMKEAKDYLDSLDFECANLHLNVGIASEEFIHKQIEEIGLSKYFTEIREEN